MGFVQLILTATQKGYHGNEQSGWLLQEGVEERSLPSARMERSLEGVQQICKGRLGIGYAKKNWDDAALREPWVSTGVGKPRVSSSFAKWGQ